MTDTATATRGHLLTITTTADHTPEDPDFDYSVTCQAPDLCGGWEECLDPHEVDGVSAADGPWDSDETDPWFEEEEFDFHGVTHEWRYGYGWTVPFKGCVVAANDGVCDAADDIGRSRGPGTYPVDDDWDDTSCYLTVIPNPESE